MTAPDEGTQRRRILAQLVQCGTRGITQADFLPPRVIDGGTPIARLASRIEELRNDHHVAIIDAGWRSKLKVYALADASTLPDLPEPLFTDLEGGMT